MAIMIPSLIEDPEAARIAHEDEIFDALKAIDDNNLYVFHSYKTLDITDSVLHEHEIDFIIFHKDLGLLFMESKASSAGQIYFDQEWRYGDGTPMKHNPFRQAEQNKWNVIKKAQESSCFSVRRIIGYTKCIHCVCFPTMTSQSCDALRADGNYSRELIISRDDLQSPEKTWKKLKEIAKIKLPGEDKFKNLSDDDARILVDNFLCPHMEVFKNYTYIDDSQNFSFNRLLDLQTQILEFLELENSVVITGGAGTGKTVVAIEKARRLAANDENVLFLCFNRELKTRLEKKYAIKNVRYYTLSGFILALTGNINDYNSASDIIRNCYFDDKPLKIGNTEYKHVIIDEGQDFGNTDDGNAVSSDVLSVRESLINDLSELILERDGCFYVFYDKQQLIQAKSVPKFIQNADSRLALRKNVRNTENIGKAALKTISDKRCYIPNTVQGDWPLFYFIESDKTDSLPKKIDKCIAKYRVRNINDIVIITASSIEKSMLNKTGRIIEKTEANYKNYYYKNNSGNEFMFTTCRKFKGCEADVVIFVDVDINSFKKDSEGNDSINNFIYYVGASRAKKNLEVFANITENECLEILPLIDGRYKNRKSLNPYRDFATALGGAIEKPAE